MKKDKNGKLVRSEIVQVRLDPKLKFAVELAARAQGRTLSNLIAHTLRKFGEA